MKASGVLQFSWAYLDPRVVHELSDGQPVSGLCLQQLVDQVLGLVGHLVPLGLRELVLTVANPSLHARGDGQAVVAVEWREATQPRKD